MSDRSAQLPTFAMRAAKGEVALAARRRRCVEAHLRESTRTQGARDAARLSFGNSLAVDDNPRAAAAKSAR
jgi:hypothetical protein